MSPIICTVGPFTIYAYGFFVMLGLLALMLSIRFNPRFNRELSSGKLQELLFWSLIVGFTGGRILYGILHPQEFDTWLEFILFNDGGFSVLGGVIALGLFLPWFARRLQVSPLTVADAAAVHGPLMHAIARIGCLFAGCCHGQPWNGWCAITYTDQLSLAPLQIPLHPTQLYSAVALLGIFLCMRFVAQRYLKKPGMLLGLYLIFTGLERGLNDILRQENLSYTLISANQIICIGLVLFGSTLLIYRSFATTKA